MEQKNQKVADVKKDIAEFSQIIDELGNKMNELINTTNNTAQDFNSRISLLSVEIDKCKKGVNGLLEVIKQLRGAK